MYQPSDRPLRDRHILVVEDDPFIALDLQGVLEVAGATVIGPAHDLSEALRLVERFAICAAVLDYRLQKGSTMPLADLLARRGIPLLFQTSDPTTSVAAAYPDATVIPKPFHANRLIAAVRALLGDRSEARS